MTGYGLKTVTLVSDATIQGTVPSNTIVQNGTHTIFAYSRPLDETDPTDNDVQPGMATTFIWAVGELAMHVARGPAPLVFNQCLSE
jgi:hypothetical protein